MEVPGLSGQVTFTVMSVLNRTRLRLFIYDPSTRRARDLSGNLQVGFGAIEPQYSMAAVVATEAGTRIAAYCIGKLRVGQAREIQVAIAKAGAGMIDIVDEPFPAFTADTESSG